jgi:hypothetical protein
LRDSVTGASVLGLAASYPMYLGFGGVLAKFGYQRKTFRDLRRETAAKSSSSGSSSGSSTASSTRASSARSRPAPTKRTTTGPSQHRSSKSRKKNRR